MVRYLRNLFSEYYIVFNVVCETIQPNCKSSCKSKSIKKMPFPTECQFTNTYDRMHKHNVYVHMFASYSYAMQINLYADS